MSSWLHCLTPLEQFWRTCFDGQSRHRRVGCAAIHQSLGACQQGIEIQRPGPQSPLVDHHTMRFDRTNSRSAQFTRERKERKGIQYIPLKKEAKKKETLFKLYTLYQ